MASYVGLPPIPKTAAADTTGMNPGNYTALFMASDFTSGVPYMEIPRMVISGGTVLAQIRVYLGTQLFDTANVGFNGITVWSARNPMVLLPGTEVKVLFTIPASAAAPTVTLWPRYDADLPANKANAL